MSGCSSRGSLPPQPIAAPQTPRIEQLKNSILSLFDGLSTFSFTSKRKGEICAFSHFCKFPFTRIRFAKRGGGGRNFLLSNSVPEPLIPCFSFFSLAWFFGGVREKNHPLGHISSLRNYASPPQGRCGFLHPLPTRSDYNVREVEIVVRHPNSFSLI